jgi:CBS domain-containing protein
MITATISEILAHKSRKLMSVAPDATVFDAIQLMAAENIGALLVMHGTDMLGLVSERDYTRKVALKGKSSKETQVRDILTAGPLASPSDTVEHCMKLMTAHRVRHLPVLEGNRVVGILSIGDLVNWIIGAQDAAISQLEGYISGHYSV